MTQRIYLNGLEFFAYHGWYAEEQKNGGKYIVQLSFDVDTNKAEISDDLNDTVDYTAIYEEIKHQMNIPSKLLEHLAARIVTSINRKYTSIRNIELKISKMNPPIDGKVESFSVEIKL